MKAFLLTFLLLLSSSPVIAQKLQPWYRVYTFDESRIEMNTSNVILGGDIGRVTFRWIFDRPEPLNTKLTYKSRLEVIEFRCSDKLYRTYEMTFLNSAGKPIHSEMMKYPYQWRALRSNGVMTTLFGQACQLIEAKLHPPVKFNAKTDDQLEEEQVHKFALSIQKTLERSKSFQPIVNRFFTADFLKRYLDDEETNWFPNLNPETAAKANRAELKKFYVASLNAGYLTSLYLISQTPLDDKSPRNEIPSERMIPADIYRLIKGHPYTLTYNGTTTGYDYLAENVGSVARMRSYTDLLEKIATLMRMHVGRIQVESPEKYKEFARLSESASQVCPDECLGLPKGTRLFELSIPPLRLQIARIEGKLKIISAGDLSR